MPPPSPQRAFTINDLALPVTYPSFIFRTLCNAGYSASALLQDTGLQTDSIQNPNTKLSFSQLRQYIQNIIRHTGDAHIGISLAQQFEPAHIGFPAYAAMTAPTLKEGLDIMTAYCFLTFPAIDFDLILSDPELSQEEAAICLRPKLPLGDIAYFVCGSALVVCSGLLKAMLRKDQLALRAEAMVAEPPDWQDVIDHAGFDIRFNRHDNRLIFDRGLLDLPLPGADPINHPRLVAACQSFAAELDFHTTAIAQVKSILEGEQGLTASFADIARTLGYSERSLRRHLEQSGTSYRKLLDQVRESRARHLVGHTTKPIQAIAHDLGFDQPSNFTRSFKRWTGQAPSAYRLSTQSHGRN